jgi:hypothetical protein
MLRPYSIGFRWGNHGGTPGSHGISARFIAGDHGGSPGRHSISVRSGSVAFAAFRASVILRCYRRSNAALPTISRAWSSEGGWVNPARTSR